jgi:putative transposase
MHKWREWQSASDNDWGVALQRETIIRPLTEQPRLTEEDILAATARLQMSRATLYRLVSRYRQRPQTSSLLPWKRGRDSRTHFLDREREVLITACLQEFYLTPQRPSIADLLRALRHRFGEHALPPPNYRSVRRRLSQFSGACRRTEVG